MGAFPSPPPWGWSTGFITTPLTMGRLPSQHLDPALPKLFWFTPTLPTCPTVAKQFWDTKRTSPDGNLKVADLPSSAMSFATAPAALANCPPLPRVISMLCMAMPKGISVEGRFRFCVCFKQFCLLHITISLDDRFLGFVVNLIGYFQLRKSIVQTALKGRAFPIDIGTFVPETIVSPIIAPLGCKIYLFSPSP
ncbi:unnamed protein product [Triticum turgidum subsp. durum]|uniref:Uncharacterized protein ycf72 n=1 Tax=Triticum turgidum subsp. durum TaxID=4567 RepID=A0A9R0Y0A6_TRITD|nr:unnamed protein product [Triticum turgidum subsp. durum]